MASLDDLLADLDNSLNDLDYSHTAKGGFVIASSAPKSAALASIDDLESDLYDFLDDYGGDDDEEEVPDALKADQFTFEPPPFLSVQDRHGLPDISDFQFEDEETAVASTVEPVPPTLGSLDFDFDTKPVEMSHHHVVEKEEPSARFDSSVVIEESFYEAEEPVEEDVAVEIVAHEERARNSESADVEGFHIVAAEEEIVSDNVSMVEEEEREQFVGAVPVPDEEVEDQVAPIHHVAEYVSVEEPLVMESSAAIVSNAVPVAEEEEVEEPVAPVYDADYISLEPLVEESSAVIVSDAVPVAGEEVVEEPVAPVNHADYTLLDPLVEESNAAIVSDVDASAESEPAKAAPEFNAPTPSRHPATRENISTSATEPAIEPEVSDIPRPQIPDASVVIEPLVATPEIPVRVASQEFQQESMEPTSPAISECDYGMNRRVSMLDGDVQVQIIRMRGQVERTRILINEQLRLRNMPSLQPGQYTLPPMFPQLQRTRAEKRNSIISTISQAVASVISNAVASPSTPTIPSQEDELQAMRDELERTRRDIAEKMRRNQGLLQRQQEKQQAPPPMLAPARTADEFPGVDKIIEYKKPSKGGDTASVTSGKSGKSTTSAGWGLFRSKSTKSLKEEPKYAAPDASKAKERKKSTRTPGTPAPYMAVNPMMMGRF
ncbi:hypothetical protein HDU98_006826 [Podochytrium sp. JEL0797]|nr:hypothetical protein HDU98_006826 [Podochytrium sp. JEL0797]